MHDPDASQSHLLGGDAADVLLDLDLVVCSGHVVQPAVGVVKPVVHLVEPLVHLGFELLDLRVHLVEPLVHLVEPFVHLLRQPGQVLVQDDAPEGLPPLGVFLQDSYQVAYVVDRSHGRGSLALRAGRVCIIFPPLLAG